MPWISLIHNGHAAFGSLDAERAFRAYRDRLCQICGQELDERCFLIVHPADQARGYSPEPALHPECLPYAAAHCPMLNGAATHYRRSPVLASPPPPLDDPAPIHRAPARHATPTKAIPPAAAAPPTGTRPG